MTKVISLIAGTVFIVAAGLLLMAAVPAISLKPLVVLTGSMSPAIKTGSVVFVEPQSSYGENDIITFRKSSLNEPVTHRIVGVQDNAGLISYVTKGDANESADLNLVGPSEVLGRVHFSIPLLGFLLFAARTKIGFTVLVILPALFVIVDEARNLMRELRKRKEANSEPQTP